MIEPRPVVNLLSALERRSPMLLRDKNLTRAQPSHSSLSMQVLFVFLCTSHIHLSRDDYYCFCGRFFFTFFSNRKNFDCIHCIYTVIQKKLDPFHLTITLANTV